MNHCIQFGSSRIDFKLVYLKRKSLGIKVHPDTTVEVLAPIDAKEDVIFQKMRKKAPWIIKQIAHFNSYRPITPSRRFINGESHLYLGRQYRLKIRADTVDGIKAYRGQLWIHGIRISPESLKEQLNEWYREKAIIVFTELLEEVFSRFSRYKIAKPSILIRTMSKRWGSCTSGGKIILNVALIKAPKICIEYVIVHELCHLVYHNHTKLFFDLLNRLMPDWKKRKDKLEHVLM